MRILFTGGGSGGHLFPIVAVVRQLTILSESSIRSQNGHPEGEARRISNLEFLFLGPNTFGQEILKQEGIPYKTILAGKVRRYASFKSILDPFAFVIGFFQALRHIFIFMPDVIFSKGGYGSAPVVLVGWLYRIPILIHESDAAPGLANRFLSRLAQRIAISFPKAADFFPSKKTALIGNPVREQIFNGSIEEAKKIFNLSGEKPVLLIMGGSQGARAINEIVLTILNQLLEKYEIIHQCGKKNYSEIQKKTKEMINYHLLPFLDENHLKHAYAAADLIISRAGAGSIFEIAGCGKPSILIPLPSSASNHQIENAYEYAKSGATIILEQANLTPNLFYGRISQLLADRTLLQKMGNCAKNFYRPDAAQKIAEEIIKLGSK